MSILVGNPFLLNTTAATGYQVSRSLRFNGATDSSYLSRTPASAGNRRTWTWSAWVKLAALSSGQNVIFSATDGSTPFAISAQSSGQILFGNLSFAWKETTAVFRDYSAWYHFCVAVDTNQASNANRLRFYVNGIEQTAFSTNRDLYLNTDLAINGQFAHEIGRYSAASNQHFNGYLAECHFIDGQQLTPSSFAETDSTTGQWIPRLYSGSYGTNGYKLTFADNSAATATTLGKDTSGNNNNWTPNNFVAAPTTIYSNYVTNQYSLYNYNGSTNLDPTAAKYLFDGGTSVAVIDWNGVYNATASPPYRLEFIPPAPISFTSQVRVYSVGGPQSPYNNRITVDLGSGYGSPISVIQNNWVTVATGAGQLHKLKATADQNGTTMSAIEIDGVILTQRTGADVDSLVDTPTSYGTDTGAGGEVRGNYCTWNPLATGNLTAVDGNLGVKPAFDYWQQIKGTISVSTGKWYWECTVNPSSTYINQYHGISNYLEKPSDNLGSVTGYCYGAGGDKYYAGGYQAGVAASYTFGDIIGIALDLDSGTQTVKFYKNGTLQFTQTITGTGPWHPASNCYYTQTPPVFYTNFGQRAFAYTAPSGFKALCDTNLTAPVIAKPSTVMDVLTWSGSGGARSFTGLGFSPDLVWGKARNASGSNHVLYDAIRGAGNNKDLSSSSTSEEGSAFMGTSIYGYLSSFDSAGFSVANGTDSNFPSAYWNQSGRTYVAWAWDAGSSTVTNTQGSITSSVRANPSAGFSIVTYSQGSTNATVGHGLNVTPGLILCKSRTNAVVWVAYHSALPKGAYLFLNGTDAAAIGDPNYWGTAGPNSTTFGVSVSGYANNLGNMVAYCWAPVTGYSSFGSYTGSAGNTFVYTGFRPRLVMIKRTDTAGSWYIIDALRPNYNNTSQYLLPNTSDGEYSDNIFDLLSNGFKFRLNAGGLDGSGGSYIYCAWAESPFQYARAR